MGRPSPSFVLVGGLLLLAWPMGARAQVAPASPELRLPAEAEALRARDSSAYTFGRAWHAVATRAREARTGTATSQPAKAGAATAVTGSFQVPVFPVLFANSGAAPWPPLDLQHQLFGGGGIVATLTDYYDEVSGGRVAVGGGVQDWHLLPAADTWYEGTSNGLDPASAHIGELIAHTLDAWDAAVDFGLYDNDGPDGLPNSGDDDGYVDFVAFVHPETGGECGGTGNLWSHRWRYTAWPASGGVPYITQDVSASGGPILVDDYVLQPGLACGGTQMIQIGVFCHEFGHAFGLPDLYDTNGGGASGLGHWCLMASGNWNVPAQPAHMSAWTKRELGWVEVEKVGWRDAVIELDPVAVSGRVLELSFTDERWRRSEGCALVGTHSLAVGLLESESAARGWPAPRGYGNGWHETVAHDFHYDGSGPVTLEYEYATDTEAGFDFCFVLLEKGGVETTLAVYDGVQSGSASHELSSILGPAPTDYRVKLRFRSDAAYSNEDGFHPAACAPFVVDDLRIVGGSVDHLADFEEHRAGWHQPDDPRDNPASECWLVENRRRVGYDANLHGEGLLLYHVDQEVVRSLLRNTGGGGDETVRGVVVEEADAGGELLAATGGNRGDEGDPWPGSAGASVFDSLSSPASMSNDGTPTMISLQGVELVGETVRATFRSGDPPPSLGGVLPAEVWADSGSVDLSLTGATGLRHGLAVRLVRSDWPEVGANLVRWIDHDRVHAEFDLSGVASGAWDLVVENPDGQTAVADSALTVRGAATAAPPDPAGWFLAQNHPNPFNPRTTLRFTVPTADDFTLTVHDARGRHVRTLVQEGLGAGHHEVDWDGTDQSGRAVASGLYFVRLRGEGFTQTRKMLLVR